MRGRIMRVEPPVHRCFVSLPCSELLNVFFFLTRFTYYHPCSLLFMKYLGGLQIFLLVSLKALCRGVQCRYMCTWNDLPDVVQEGSDRPGRGTRSCRAHISTHRMLVSGICCREKSQKGLLFLAASTETWQTEPVWGSRFLTSVQYPLGARGGLCQEGLLTGAGRNTFKGVLNQQGLVWLFPCTVLFEHVVV